MSNTADVFADIKPNVRYNGTGKVMALFGESPEILESIEKARLERKLSYRQIATVLSRDPEIEVSAEAVKTYLDKKGIS